LDVTPPPHLEPIASPLALRVRRFIRRSRKPPSPSSPFAFRPPNRVTLFAVPALPLRGSSILRFHLSAFFFFLSARYRIFFFFFFFFFFPLPPPSRLFSGEVAQGFALVLLSRKAVRFHSPPPYFFFPKRGSASSVGPPFPWSAFLVETVFCRGRLDSFRHRLVIAGDSPLFLSLPLLFALPCSLRAPYLFVRDEALVPIVPKLPSTSDDCRTIKSGPTPPYLFD